MLHYDCSVLSFNTLVKKKENQTLLKDITSQFLGFDEFEKLQNQPGFLIL